VAFWEAITDEGSNKFDNKIISLSNINHIVEKENIISRNKKYNKYLGGFTSINKVVLLKNFIFTFNPILIV